MVVLSEEKFILVQKYRELLKTIEEAFLYILESFTNLELTEGDEILEEIFEAFTQIYVSNIVLTEHFQDAPRLLDELGRFENVIEKAELLEWTLHSEKVIREELHPVFSEWSLQMQQELQPYLIM